MKYVIPFILLVISGCTVIVNSEGVTIDRQSELTTPSKHTN